ncbi:MAG: hypothetical protein GXO97_03910 [Nitrospirae bacterium]|nr:hypothetical protein [Nitrospirota bacterium]
MSFIGNICAWCNKEISEDSEVFGLGARIIKNILSKEMEGKIIPFQLVKTDKTIPAIVTTSDSEAKKDGYDLLFMTCSKACAESLKKTLNKEKELFGLSDFI